MGQKIFESGYLAHFFSEHDEIWQRYGPRHLTLISWFGEFWSRGPSIPCNDMHQSFTDALAWNLVEHWETAQITGSCIPWAWAALVQTYTLWVHECCLKTANFHGSKHSPAYFGDSIVFSCINFKLNSDLQMRVANHVHLPLAARILQLVKKTLQTCTVHNFFSAKPCQSLTVLNSCYRYTELFETPNFLVKNSHSTPLILWAAKNAWSTVSGGTSEFCNCQDTERSHHGVSYWTVVALCTRKARSKFCALKQHSKRFKISSRLLVLCLSVRGFF